jgi:hypothetical protein
MRAHGYTSATSRYPWRIFWVLVAAGVLASVGALPYILALFGERIAALGGRPVSLPLLAVTQTLQMSLLFGAVVGFGLLLARKVGIHTPLLSAWLYGQREESPRGGVVLSVGSGVVLGLITAAVFGGFVAPRTPAWPSEAGMPVWMRLLAAAYGGIDEELLMRLFLLSLVLWLLQALRGSLEFNATMFWIGNAVAALIFAAAYLPAASYLGALTGTVLVAIMGVKGISGLVFGYLCWSRGLESAMLAHFITDLVMHLLGPIFGG